MKILLCNDDGILAPGLIALYRVLTRFGQVSVVAPETQQSAAGHSITLHTPLRVSHVRVADLFDGHSVDGRPADCVKLACRALLTELPDLVVSGINAGANVGVNVIYSGTVAAAVEGAFFKLPSIAFSQQMGDAVDFDASADCCGRVLDRLIALEALRPGLLLNVNVPRPTATRPRPLGLRVVGQSTAVMRDSYTTQIGPDGRTYYWISNPEAPDLTGEDSDATALDAGYVTVTPLHFDLTNREALPDVAGWNWGGWGG
ncbi:MAG: 5'-nucleotidase SurE [Phycisphaerae bacterium]|nr:5'-nucleotidase SurE [Phycisphaerae bacterium]